MDDSVTVHSEFCLYPSATYSDTSVSLNVPPLIVTFISCVDVPFEILNAFAVVLLENSPPLIVTWISPLSALLYNNIPSNWPTNFPPSIVTLVPSGELFAT